MEETYLNKLLVARTVQGRLVAVGKCVSYCDAPTVNIQNANGTNTHWPADMCEVMTVSQDVAEQLMGKVIA